MKDIIEKNNVEVQEKFKILKGNLPPPPQMKRLKDNKKIVKKQTNLVQQKKNQIKKDTKLIKKDINKRNISPNPGVTGTASLENVFNDLQQILKKLKPDSNKERKLQLRIEQKQFFKLKKQQAQQEKNKFGGTIEKLSTKTLKTGCVNKKTQKIINQSSKIIKNQLINKINNNNSRLSVLTKDDIENFKRKIILNANQLARKNEIIYNGDGDSCKENEKDLTKEKKLPFQSTSQPIVQKIINITTNSNDNKNSKSKTLGNLLINSKNNFIEKENLQTKNLLKDINQTKNRKFNSSIMSINKKSSKNLQKKSSVLVRRSNVGVLNQKRSNVGVLNQRRSNLIVQRISGRSNSTLPSKTSHITIRSTPSIKNPLLTIRNEVNKAIKDGKTFTVRGNYQAVRKSLLKRGWIEKLHTSCRDKLQLEARSLRSKNINELEQMLHVKELNDICKKLIKSKLLITHQVDLYWGPNKDAFDINSDKIKYTKINKFKRDVFSYTSKQGLCDAAKCAHWFNFPGLARINHPRTYDLGRIASEKNEFIKDFRRTAALSLIKWTIDKNSNTHKCKIVSLSGKVPMEAYDFAINEAYKMLSEATNQDIDHPIKNATDEEWCQFLEYFYKIMHMGNHLKIENNINEEIIVEKSKFIIEKLLFFYTNINMDGIMNIWILKPAAGSQGRGIHICRTLQYILQTIKTNSCTRYIIQKYIERPLLIFKTKFDIRQWFLISSAQPLTIWMYKECYLRFSSQTYNLRKLHESIHLTNNSVQQRYPNISHDITLPNYNMWDSIQFKRYLSNIGYPDVYKTIIYKQMKECIIGAVLIHQDKIDKRKNSFELYGADFMLTEDFQPFLIEINSSPALYASTPITARMCPLVLEDTIKVIVDYSNDPTAKTGNFELIYKQPNLYCNIKNTTNMKLSGIPLTNDYFYPDIDGKNTSISTINTINTVNEKSKTDIICLEMKETLEKLSKYIKTIKKNDSNIHSSMITKGTDPIDIKNENDSFLSITNLKKQLKTIKRNRNNNDKLTKNDEKLINQILKILKNKNNTDVAKYLYSVLEKSIN